MNSIAIIGCGNIGQSIAEGLITADPKASRSIVATKRNLSSLKRLKTQGVQLTTDNQAAVQQAVYIIIAVKPYMVTDVMTEIAPVLKKNHVLISVAS